MTFCWASTFGFVGCSFIWFVSTKDGLPQGVLQKHFVVRRFPVSPINHHESVRMTVSFRGTCGFFFKDWGFSAFGPFGSWKRRRFEMPVGASKSDVCEGFCSMIFGPT